MNIFPTFDSFLDLSPNEIIRQTGRQHTGLLDYFRGDLLALSLRSHIDRYRQFIELVYDGYNLDILSYINDLSRREHLFHIRAIIPDGYTQQYDEVVSKLDRLFMATTYSIERHPPFNEEPYASQFWLDRMPLSWKT